MLPIDLSLLGKKSLIPSRDLQDLFEFLAVCNRLKYEKRQFREADALFDSKAKINVF